MLMGDHGQGNGNVLVFITNEQRIWSESKQGDVYLLAFKFKQQMLTIVYDLGIENKQLIDLVDSKLELWVVGDEL